jgi:hypothetical protein
MLREIEELRKMLNQQSQKYRSLEEENEHMKAKLRILSLKESREVRSDLTEDMIKSTELIEIRMPQKIESPPNQINIQINTEL